MKVYTESQISGKWESQKDGFLAFWLLFSEVVIMHLFLCPPCWTQLLVIRLTTPLLEGVSSPPEEALTHRQDWNTTSAIEATSEVIESHFCTW